jgi:hypothetical protein
VNVTADSTAGVPITYRALRVYGDGHSSAGIGTGTITPSVTFPGAAIFDGVFVCPRAGTLQNLRGRVEVGMAIDYTWTLGVLTLIATAWTFTASSITITIPAGSTSTISDTTHTLAVNAGDKIVLLSQQANGTSNNTVTRPQASAIIT